MQQHFNQYCMKLTLKEHLINFNLPPNLIELIINNASVKKYKAGEYFFYEDYSLEYTSLLIKGSLELYIESNNKKTLLYSLTSKQVCVASLTNLFNGYSVNFSSIALEECILIALPIRKITKWSIEFPLFRRLIMKSHQYHYNSVLKVIQFFTDESIEDRLISYLKLKISQQNSNSISIPHQQIANDINCTREVITRTLKKLEKKNILTRNVRSISFHPNIEGVN